MKKILGIILGIFLSFSLLSCTRSIFERGTTTVVVPKSTKASLVSSDFRGSKMLTTYQEYKELGINLYYDEEFFDDHKLYIFYKQGCSTNHYLFSRVIVDAAALYPVISEHKIEKDEALTEDIIDHIFYCEFVKTATFGKVLYQDETEARYYERGIDAFFPEFRSKIVPKKLDIKFDDSYVGEFTLENEEEIKEILDILKKGTYSYSYGALPAPGTNRYITIHFDDSHVYSISTRFAKEFSLNSDCSNELDTLLEERGLERNALKER